MKETDEVITIMKRNGKTLSGRVVIHAMAFDKLIRRHERWLSTGGEEGKRLNLGSCHIEGFTINQVNMSQATFDNCYISGTFFECRMDSVVFRKCVLYETTFQSSPAELIRLDNTSVYGCRLVRTSWVKALILGNKSVNLRLQFSGLLRSRADTSTFSVSGEQSEILDCDLKSHRTQIQMLNSDIRRSTVWDAGHIKLATCSVLDSKFNCNRCTQIDCQDSSVENVLFKANLTTVGAINFKGSVVTKSRIETRHAPCLTAVRCVLKECDFSNIKSQDAHIHMSEVISCNLSRFDAPNAFLKGSVFTGTDTTGS